MILSAISLNCNGKFGEGRSHKKAQEAQNKIPFVYFVPFCGKSPVSRAGRGFDRRGPVDIILGLFSNACFIWMEASYR